MDISKAEKKQIENEMIFRRMNEKVGTGLDALDDMHIKDGNPHLVVDEDMLLQFKCECSDENCEKRIPLKLKKYREIHADRDTFIVLKNHQLEPIEKVIAEEESYNIVKKNHSTPEPSGQLNDTTTDSN